MTYQITPESAARKRAEHLVVGELLKRDVLPYPLTPGASHTFKSRTPTGRTIEMRVEISVGNSKGDERRFRVPDFEPCPELFFLCVEFTNTAENVAPDHSADRGTVDGIRISNEIGCVWVLPSTVFFVYSEPDEEERPARTQPGREAGTILRTALPGIQLFLPQPMGVNHKVRFLPAIHETIGGSGIRRRMGRL